MDLYICMTLRKRAPVLSFPAILNQALGSRAFPRRQKRGVVGSIFWLPFAVIPSGNKNFSERFAGGSARRHFKSVRSRVNNVKKLGDERSDRSPVIADECCWILAYFKDIYFLVSLHQFDDMFMVPLRYAIGFLYLANRISSRSTCKTRNMKEHEAH